MEKYDKILSKYIGRTNHPMCKASEIGKIVINKCIDQAFSVNAPKLQKLLVMMQGKCLLKYEKELFKEDVIAWSCGVAIKEVNTEFKNYKSHIDGKQQAYIILLDYEEEIIDEVLKEFGNQDAITINSDPRLNRLFVRYYEEGKSNIIPKNVIKDVFMDDLR